MSDLSKKKCVACDGDIPPFDKSEIHNYLKKVDGWDVKSNDDKSFYLIKNFNFTITPPKKNIRVMIFLFSYIANPINKFLAFFEILKLEIFY